MTEDPYRAARDDRAHVHLQAASAALVVLFVVFTPYNFVMLPERIGTLAAAHDLFVAATSAGVVFALRKGTLAPRHAHPAALALALFVASNIALVQVGTGQEIQLFYQALLLCAVGVVMTRTGWAMATLAIVGVSGFASYALTWPLDRSFVHVAFAQFAVALLSLALVIGRGWYIDRITELSLRDKDREAKLRDALAQARDAERRLDAKVARRTSELRWTNEALRKQLEELERARHEKETLHLQLQHAQRVEAMGQLTGGVAHDFNNLVTAVIGNIELALREVAPDSPAAKSLRDAKASAFRAGRLTKRLLSFGRADGAIAEVTDLHGALDGLTQVVARLLGENVRLSIGTLPGPAKVAIDPVQLDQVLINLVVNARDAMPDGGRIDVRATTDGMQAVIEVQDTGTGMDEATQGRIFDPYFTTKAPGSGTGLGLATVARIVEGHGGTIEVHSELGEGTTFRVLLPLAELEDQERRSPAPPTPPPRGRGERVLLVEDEDAVRRIAIRMLERLGYQAIHARSGPEALRILGDTDTRVDLLWTDVRMPGMDGRELADQLRTLQPDLPVLFTSGYSDDALAPCGVLQAATNFLPKPYNTADVARAVRRALDGA